MKPGKIILYIIYLTVTSLVLLEAGVRLWGYSERYIYDPIYKPCPQCEDIPYIHKPCLSQARARGLAVINTDSLGLRSIETCAEYGKKGAHELRIAITGDSVTFGEGVPDTSLTFAAQLEKILGEENPGLKVRVFNFGVSAYSVKEMAATAACRMPLVQPDIMIMAIIPEDFNLGRTGTVDKWGYTVHASSDSGIANRDSSLKKFLRSVHLTYLFRDIYYRYREAGNERDEAIYPEERIPSSYKYILKFRDAAETQHAKPLVILLPSLGHGFTEKFRDQLGKDHINFLDLSNLVNQIPRKDYMASPFDPHPSATVHGIIAKRTAEFLKHKLTLFTTEDNFHADARKATD